MRLLTFKCGQTVLPCYQPVPQGVATSKPLAAFVTKQRSEFADV